MDNLTQMEKCCLNALINNLYAEPGFSDVNAADISQVTGYNTKQVRGVLASLVKKNYIWISDNDPHNGIPPLIYLQEKHYGLHPEWKDDVKWES